MAKNDLIGNAGVYWVVSQLSLRGLVALPTVRNCPGADILVLDPDTGAAGTIQVKTSGKRPNFWPTSVPSDVWRRSSHAYVFLRRKLDGQDFEAFLAEAPAVATAVEGAVEYQRSRERRIFPCFALPQDPAAVKNLTTAWRDWRPTAR